MDLGEAVGLAGLVAGIAWLVYQPRLRWSSLVGALVASAAGEVTVVLASHPSNEPISWWALVVSYPLAVLSVGGWGVLLSGFASLAIGAPGVRYRVPASVAAYLMLGALAGVGLSSALVLTRSGGSGNYLFAPRPLFLAGVVAGFAGGAACLLWQLVATPSNHALEPTART